MKKLQVSKDAKNAILLGGMCTVAYFAVYISRNILSAVTPQITEQGIFSTENIGTLSSIYFIAYAIGQLINGIIGDKIKAKYMLSLGLLFAGICNFILPIISGSLFTSYCAYGLTGFFLSMIYGPMTKVVTENTTPIHAVRCGVGYSFASFFGSPLAGIFAAVFSWSGAFYASSFALIFMAIVCFTGFIIFEKKGIVKYNLFEKSKEKSGGIKILFKHHIVKFTLVSIITGIVRISVVFWLPTYISEYLEFDPKTSALIFTVATLFISTTAFIALFVYEKLNRDMNRSILLFFICATLSFLIVFLVKQPLFNIIFMVLAILSSNGAASILWSMYCPSLRDTGMVSSATGFLDFVNYIAAAIASAAFANAVSDIGWNSMILIWMALMILGIIVALPYNKIFKKQ